MRDLNNLNRYRYHMLERELEFPRDEKSLSLGGVFLIPTKGVKRGLKVIASSGLIKSSHGWDHVSVSLPNRCPTWDEMCKVKDLFFFPNEVCVQYHPAEENYISNHKYCLHLFRHIDNPFPMPPESLVGVKSMATVKPGTISREEVFRIQNSVLNSLDSKIGT